MHHKAVNRMRKNCSRKAYLKRVGAAVLAGTMLLAAMPGTAFAAYAPVTGNPEDTSDAATWARLQDNVLEYDEIPDLVHVYNSSISEIWKNLRESKEKIDRNIQELDSQRGKMKNLKDEAKDQGNWTGYGNYTMQEIILGKVASGLRSTDLYNQKTVAGIQKGEKQITKAAQSLMITYDSLLKQRNTLEKLQELYAKQYQIAVNKHALGMATDQDVLTAQTNQLSAASSVASLDGGLLKLKPTLCTLTGWAADASPELAPIPETDLTQIDQMNLEEDTKKAIGNNSTLISQRTSAKGTSNASIESRLGVIEEGEQKLTIEMKRLYNDVYTQKETFEGARAGYQAAQKTHDKYTRMYQMGLLGESDYIGTEISYYQAKSSYESADTALRLAMETYNWGVQGLASIE